MKNGLFIFREIFHKRNLNAMLLFSNWIKEFLFIMCFSFPLFFFAYETIVRDEERNMN